VRRIHAVAAAAALGVAGVAGTYAATRSVDLGVSSAAVSPGDDAIASEAARLDREERALKAALAEQPPALPPLATSSASRTAPAVASGPAQARPRVVYVRPRPVLVSRTSGEDEHGDHEDEHGDDDGHEEHDDD